jgi:hypothetical protein
MRIIIKITILRSLKNLSDADILKMLRNTDGVLGTKNIV